MEIDKNNNNYLFYTLIISLNVLVTLIIFGIACLCCKKKIPKNEFGLQGMLKIKNPEDNLTEQFSQTSTLLNNNNKSNHNQQSNLQQNANISSKKLNGENASMKIDLNSSMTQNDNSDCKRAPHRSLPDIPVAEALNNDNISELYGTQSQQDVSSPYARVKTPTHEYDNVRSEAEHPYAQLTAPGTSIQSSATTAALASPELNSSSNKTASSSHQSLLLPLPEDRTDGQGPVAGQNENLQMEGMSIAGMAIAGRISASMELPYITPVMTQQHFSGDSDSSKGYTSISVREPLANILAQTKTTYAPQRMLTKNDSHYATVSDDSDEMYAAIEDPNSHGDIYTSGSETYAQIQPAVQSVTVSVHTNTRPHESEPTSSNHRISTVSRESTTIKHINETPIPPPVDSLRTTAQIQHSRQASTSSNDLGSPKPEKRQANSPLPPTPKGSSSSNLTSISSLIPSGRNSVASVIEHRFISKENINAEPDESSPNKKKFSPSKDIEGMYAKVMKKTKFSNIPSQSNSPILNRRDLLVDFNKKEGSVWQSNENNFQTSSSVTNPPTLYIEKSFNNLNLNEAGYESLPSSTNDPGYEKLLNPCKNDPVKSSSDYDPNYEVLKPPKNKIGDDGYAKVLEKPRSYDDDEQDAIDGYSKVKERKDPGYSSISEVKDEQSKSNKTYNSKHHDYASIIEAKDNNLNQISAKANITNNNIETNLSINIIDEDELDIYSTIEQKQTVAHTRKNETEMEKPIKLQSTEKLMTPSTGQNSPLGSSTTSKFSSSTTGNLIYESLESESDPNYESLKTENPYERLHSDSSLDNLGAMDEDKCGRGSSISCDGNLIRAPVSNASSPNNELSNNKSINSLNRSENGEVDDYFHV